MVLLESGDNIKKSVLIGDDVLSQSANIPERLRQLLKDAL